MTLRDQADVDEVACVLCGCTEDRACEGGCWWMPTGLAVDVCSACVDQLLESAIAERARERLTDHQGALAGGPQGAPGGPVS